MRALVLIHRWLGIAFCLLFAMWFASGLVMHFVPYPSLEESERIAGLSAFNLQEVIAPAAALKALEVHKVRRMRLVNVGGVPTYIGPRSDGTTAAITARDGKPLVVDETAALTSASVHAQSRALDASQARIEARDTHDQWTVANGFDAHRPLYRVALNDMAQTELYVSSVTGEVVLDTTRFERACNWAGSVVHWIYPTVLRQNWAAWDSTVWWLSLIAMLGALTGLALGVLRLNKMRSPFRGWMKWHHVLGLTCSLFVMTWIFSGWLSMDHGRIFSRGDTIGDDRMRIEGRALSAPDMPGLDGVGTSVREVEWFPFAGQIMTRVVDQRGTQQIHMNGERTPWITPAHIAQAARTLARNCTHGIVEEHAAYPAKSVTKSAPVYRITCGDVWFHVDGANGKPIEKLDASRRAYRWAFQALHTFDFPALSANPALRTTIIVLLCLGGFAFSVSGMVIGWRRLKRTLN